MTFSIVATEGDAWGVAVASKFLAVGAAVPAARAGVGAVATQSLANLRYRPDGLRLLAAGTTAQQTLDILVADDDGRADRQAGIVDAHGGAASYTGSDCEPWAGDVTGPGVAIQGNTLTGAEVVESMHRAWQQSRGRPLSRRLLAALADGDDAGGDRRGRQSAALLVVTPQGGYGGGSDVLVDLRVDDHPHPVHELTRLLDQHDVYFGRADPATAHPLAGDVAEETRRRLAALGYDEPDLDAALTRWAGMANLEERLLVGHIDPVVLDQLRAAS